MHGGGGNDNLRGNNDNNVIWGANGNDHLYGRNGNDILYGGSGADRLDGGAGTDRAQYNSAAGPLVADLQYSNLNTGDAAGDIYVNIENLHGGGSNDYLRGDNGNNVIWGGGGNDHIQGRGGNDVLVGHSGSDTFVFLRYWDQDQINDFENNVDRIELHNLGLSSASHALSYASQVGGNVIFDFGSNDMLTVVGTTFAELQNDIFVF